jgi:CMP-N-acetylneuraminic acid synthetase
MIEKKYLVVIPARGGSKGIPKKNIKLMNGKPLIYYTIDVARSLFEDCDICVSTDDEDIIATVERYGLKVPFRRPEELATDTATTNDVLLHALDYYESLAIKYETIILLQPTSPLRMKKHVEEAIVLYNDTIDMVVSVRESHLAQVLCQENEKGYLVSIFNKDNLRRQDIAEYYEYDGSVYIINAMSLKNKGLSNMDKKVKYIISAECSIDIDNQLDWDIAEFLLKRNSK